MVLGLQPRSLLLGAAMGIIAVYLSTTQKSRAPLSSVWHRSHSLHHNTDYVPQFDHQAMSEVQHDEAASPVQSVVADAVRRRQNPLQLRLPVYFLPSETPQAGRRTRDLWEDTGAEIAKTHPHALLFVSPDFASSSALVKLRVSDGTHDLVKRIQAMLGSADVDVRVPHLTVAEHAVLRAMSLPHLPIIQLALPNVMDSQAFLTLGSLLLPLRDLQISIIVTGLTANGRVASALPTFDAQLSRAIIGSSGSVREQQVRALLKTPTFKQAQIHATHVKALLFSIGIAGDAIGAKLSIEHEQQKSYGAFRFGPADGRRDDDI
ncbi:uncharacterized protein L969DRAFT_185938 [Mixia osmundae IAM 14324]|uniref:Extradiol ring-cleavage dioxygenase class III enzyme subunit B domain-containing protein n=1 Tax=Mixia osmundae (strain CBS 9802 / IAM 14324 / JCM 22182 / KY 12970) TaxID=764103 RepID=G7DT80_MIXOS|nr:uncharacterized protein L969DRAFT_185938 [Mixia osmundae IAM 14324]KEI42935.1 hypothetical protein L969DRAFT_185938 [Mixia osmundae IAM 14324]GAA93727.1 hypothetical protein E5Q_00373 [Mixia osmundae IAM 14324]